MDKPDFGPGDLVVCVDAPMGHLRVGSVWRVLALRCADWGPMEDRWGVRFTQMPEDCDYWVARFFRKIDRAEDAFIAQIRACKPVRETSHA